MNKKLAFLLIIVLLGPAILAFVQAPIGELPPRPPTIAPTLGAQIALAPPPGVIVWPAWWSVVQWRDAAGHWHDVDGWQGTFDAAGRVVWWVGPEHLGSGPFRWVVYESPERLHEVGQSEPFYLPSQHRTVLEVGLILSAAE